MSRGTDIHTDRDRPRGSDNAFPFCAKLVGRNSCARRSRRRVHDLLFSLFRPPDRPSIFQNVSRTTLRVPPTVHVYPTSPMTSLRIC